MSGLVTAAVIGGVAALAGAGATIYAANKSGKGYASTSGLGYGDYKGAMKDSAEQQGKLYEKQLKLALKYYPAFAAAERKATGEQRNTDLADLQATGPGFGSTFAGLSPAYANLLAESRDSGAGSALLDKLNEAALTVQPSAIRTELEKQAMAELSLGRSLSPEQERAATQSARLAYAARGLQDSGASLAAEVLNRDSYAGAREAGRRTFAANVHGLGMAESEADRGFSLNVQGAIEAAKGNYRNFLLGASTAELDPIFRSTIANRTNVSPAIAATVLQTAPTVAGLSSAVSPYWNYNWNADQYNANAATSAAIARQNAIAGLGSGMMQGGSSMIGSAMQAYAATH